MSSGGEIVLVAAMATNRVIGAKGAIPWHIPADFRRVKALTMGCPLVMGRKTFESLPGLLPGRCHIVVTGSAGWRAEGAQVAASLAEALALADAPRIIIFGGARLYAEALPLASRIELTEVHADFAGDTRMPGFGPGWREIFREEHAAENGRPSFAFATLIRDL